ncbi:g4245 [Coccomyxa elongata]
MGRRHHHCQLHAGANADVDQLPSRQELLSRFGLFQCECTPEVAPNGVVSCGCEECARWQAFLEGRLPGGPTWRQYEVWTREYVTALAAYMWQRAEQLELERLVILEVGAGDGRLSAYLQVALAATCPAAGLCAIELRCSDNGSNVLHASSPFRDLVEMLPCEEALGKHRPAIVLCSWMPLGVDWTSSMRACPQVKEYILIGEADGGICGHPMLTWGGDTIGDDPDQAAQREHSCMDIASTPDQAQQPARICMCTLASSDELGEQRRGSGHDHNECNFWGCADTLLKGDVLGEVKCAASLQRRAAEISNCVFQRVDLAELSALQLGRTDERWLTATKSRTVSFRRC